MAPAAPTPGVRSSAGYLWAMLRARLFESLPLTCPNCGADRGSITLVTDAAPVERIPNTSMILNSFTAQILVQPMSGLQALATSRAYSDQRPLLAGCRRRDDARWLRVRGTRRNWQQRRTDRA